MIKGGLYLEQARRLRTLAFDKTGTLTTGRPTLEAFEVIDYRVPLERQRQWAASLAARSDHRSAVPSPPPSMVSGCPFRFWRPGAGVGSAG